MAGKDDSDEKETFIALTAMAAGAAFMFAYQNWWNSSSSNSADSSSPSSSTESTARSRRTARKRRRELANEIESLSSQISTSMEAKRKPKDFSSTLHSEIMKFEGYDKASLEKAFDFLVEHEDHGRAFLAKNDKLQQAWLADFFSSKDQ